MKQFLTYLFITTFLFTAQYTVSNSTKIKRHKTQSSTVDSLDTSFLNWHHKGAKTDKIYGANINQIYEKLLSHRKPEKKIIVAIIDGGIDIHHKDLKGKIWTNELEIPGNGIDDDDNGYIDDINGWNFLGNAKGDNINSAPLEFVRIFRKFRKKAKGRYTYKSKHLKNKKKIAEFTKCQRRFDSELREYKLHKRKVEQIEKKIILIKKHFTGLDKTLNITCKEDALKLKAKTKKSAMAKRLLIRLYEKGYNEEAFLKYAETTNLHIEKFLNINYFPRKIIGDNLNEISECFYGNNDVTGDFSDHGTFVAGIIAANRGNGFGIDGIATNVEIMAIRGVPQGDEYDKDIALSIRYAVDNGANIINLSFGKDYSQNKQFVDDAVRYAEENSVLIINSAGNEAYNLDKINHFPNKYYSEAIENENLEASNWITVAANASTFNKEFVGSFSNYGKKTVDLFAPGVDIISLASNNTYAIKSGTSFSCPIVTGIAALIWSHFPYLTAVEIKEILLKTSNTYKKKVNIPNTNSKVKPKKIRFKHMSVTGGVIDAYKAFKLAEKMSNQSH